MVGVENKIQRYDSYKHSGVEWLGEIPEHWELLANKYVFKLKKNQVGKNSDNYDLLSLTLRGIVIRNIEDGGKFPAEYDTYQEVKNGDFVFCLFDVEETPRGVGLSKYDGMITGAYTVMEPKTGYDRGFLYYFYLNLDTDKRLRPLYTGLRNTISKDNFFAFKTFVPPLSEQTAIAQFLDDKTSKIDHAVSVKEKQIELLKERKQILIHKVVTRGLDDTVTLKDSGVAWIGEIPEHWEVKRLKNVCYINQKALPDTTNKDFEFQYVDIGSVNLEDGIIETEKYLFKNSPSRARRIAKPGDTIISTVRTYLKAIDFINEEKSKYIYSTGFAVLQPVTFIYPEYLANFVRSDAFTEQVTINSKGMSYPAINSTDLSRLFVVHPDIEEQKEISDYIEIASQKIDTAISLKQQEIEKLKEYKSSLINSVVTGKIRVANFKINK